MAKGRLLAVLAVLAGVAGFAWMSIYGLHNDPRELPSALLDKPFPEFSQPMLGEPERLLTRKDLLGKPALVNVWATWCPTCYAEHGFLVTLAEQGIPIFGVNYKDDVPAAQKWLKELHNPYVLSVVDADGRLGVNLGVFGAPETYVVDKESVIRYKHIGVVDEKVWTQTLQPLMAKYQ